MPLFECSKCRCIENQSFCYFKKIGDKRKDIPLCSECDPDIGKWHGYFKKETIKEGGVDFSGKDKDGFLLYKIHQSEFDKLRIFVDIIRGKEDKK